MAKRQSMLFVWGCEQTLVDGETARVVETHRTGLVFSRDQKLKPRYPRGWGLSTKPAAPADARETSRRIARRGRLDFRAQVGWFSRAGVSRWRRDFHPKPRRKTTQSLLS